MTFGNYNQPLNATYNARLQPTSFTAIGISMTFQYFDDGRIKFSHDAYDQRFDRSYGYDHAGRLSRAYSGAEARGEAATNSRPYKQDYTFDVWGNLTSRTGKHWSHSNTFFGTYTDNRMDGWQYDADGRNTVSNSVTSSFDAAGSLIQTSSPQRRNNPPLVLQQGFDGDGQRVKKVEYGETFYFLRSTVLGGAVVTEIYGGANQFFGQQQRGHVYLNGIEVAQQIPTLSDAVYLPSNLIRGTQVGAIETEDPLGNDAGDEDPYLPDSGDPGFAYPHMGDMSDPGGGCVRDGIPMSCSMAFNKSRLSRVLDLFLPRFGRFRPSVNFPGTPPIASNSEITFGSIFNGATEGTVLGGLLNPKLDWRFIVPFTPWGSLFASPQDTPSTCERMAQDAQGIASGILDDVKNIYNRVSPADSLQMFNRSFGMVTFGSYFTESPLGFLGTQASSRNNVLGTRDYRGQDGFAQRFWDEAEMRDGDPNPDQVHHFGAYFSAGLTGHKLAPDVHRADDRDFGHMGDVRLADQSRTLGDYLRRNPAQLRKVGQLIRDTICGGGPIPK
jgi:hypothetical protein